MFKVFFFTIAKRAIADLGILFYFKLQDTFEPGLCFVGLLILITFGALGWSIVL